MQESFSFDKDLRQAIRETVIPLARGVKSTLGPSGTNVGILSEIRLPVIVNDGVSVSKKFKFNDPLQKYLANIIKTVSQNTDNIAGDGTTTSITLAEAIILEGLKYVDVGFSQIDISSGIKKATISVLKKLKGKTIQVKNNKERLLHVASISANNDPELGELISDAFAKVGVNGQIDVKDSHEERTYVDIISGMKYNCGFESQMFTNNDKSEAVLENCRVLIYEGKLRNIDPILELLRDVRNDNDSLLIIADDYDKQCVDDLAANKIQHKLRVCAVKSPNFGKLKEDTLEDIAFITGASIISNKLGVEIDEWTHEMIGQASKVKVDSESFTIMEDFSDKDALEKRVAELKTKSKRVGRTEKDEILERIAKLTNGVAVMYVWGNSPVEIAEKKYRIEDAVNATRASMEEGIIPGGGVALLRLSDTLRTPRGLNEGEKIGFDIIKRALKSPAKTIVENSGGSPDLVLDKILSENSFNYGYDAKSNKYGDMVEMGIIDPIKVTKAALTNASSVSQMLLTMNCAVYE